MDDRVLSGNEPEKRPLGRPQFAQNLHSFADSPQPASAKNEVLVRDVKRLATSDPFVEMRERRRSHRRVTAGDLFDAIVSPEPMRSVESRLLMEIAGMREN
jgi:hypothetical protein